MAGTLMGLGLSQQFDINGDPLSGGKLYIYAANTSTPVNVYSDLGLTVLRPWPLVCDSTGRLPSFWLADGNYRALLRDVNGVVQFDEPNIPALGASTTTGSPPGGTGDPTQIEQIFSTGDMKWRPINNTLAQWVRCNGRTISDSGKGGTEMAAATAQNLYQWLWDNVAFPSGNVICPVIGGLGASSSADWAAPNKPITLLDMRGRSLFGLDDMGNVAANMFSGVTFGAGTPILGGSRAGQTMMTLVNNNLPTHAHAAFINDPTHSHVLVNGGVILTSAGGSFSGSGPLGAQTTIQAAATGVRVKSTSGGAPDDQTAPVGLGTAFATVSPLVVGTWYMKL